MSEVSLSDQRLAFVDALLTLARKHNALELTFDGVTVKLYPAVPTRRTGDKPLEVPLVPTCKCGHPLSNHPGGVCNDCGPSESCLRAKMPGA